MYDFRDGIDRAAHFLPLWRNLNTLVKQINFGSLSKVVQQVGNYIHLNFHNGQIGIHKLIGVFYNNAISRKFFNFYESFTIYSTNKANKCNYLIKINLIICKFA